MDSAGSDEPHTDRTGSGRTTPRTKASLLWGVIGALVFLVLVQGYTLFVASEPAIGVLATLGVAVVVGVCGAVSSYALSGWLARSERS